MSVKEQGIKVLEIFLPRDTQSRNTPISCFRVPPLADAVISPRAGGVCVYVYACVCAQAPSGRGTRPAFSTSKLLWIGIPQYCIRGYALRHALLLCSSSAWSPTPTRRTKRLAKVHTVPKPVYQAGNFSSKKDQTRFSRIRTWVSTCRRQGFTYTVCLP